MRRMSKQTFINNRDNHLNIWRSAALLTLSANFLFQSNLILASTEDGRWHASIGDPTFFGWITVLFYLIAVVQCGFKAISSKNHDQNYRFWLYLAVFLFLLCINKQLDLQSWLTQSVRDSALAHGWYEYRRSLQAAFIAILGLGMMFTLVGLRIFLANSWRQHKLTWVGIVLLCTFILMRAASFHHLDLFINHHVLGFRVNVILEIGAILLIILGSLNNKKRM